MSISGFNKVNTDLSTTKTNIKSPVKKEEIVKAKSETTSITKKDEVSTSITSSSSSLKNLFSKAFASFSGKKVDSEKLETFKSIKNEFAGYIKNERDNSILKFTIGKKGTFGNITNKKEVAEFSAFAKKELSSENIEFVRSIKDISKLKDPVKFKEGVRNLYNNYVKNDIVNIPGKTKKEMLSALESGNIKDMVTTLKKALNDTSTNIIDTKFRLEEEKSKTSNLLEGLKNLKKEMHSFPIISNNILPKKDILGRVTNQNEINNLMKVAKKEYSTENIDFIKAINNMTNIKDVSTFKNEIRSLLNTFVKEDSERPINITKKLGDDLETALNSDKMENIVKALSNIMPTVVTNISDTLSRAK